MSNEARPRGLGRGLSALLGEPMRTEPPRPGAYEPPTPPATPTPAASGAVVHSFPQPAPDAPAPQPAPVPPAAAVAGQGGAEQIQIDKLDRNPNQPRRHFDEAELDELAQSIRAHGVLQPILVRPSAEAPDRYEIVAGERRWRAAQRAGLKAIPALVRALDEADLLEIAIIENVQRSDLNPLEEAQGYQALMDRFGRTQAEVAEVVGKSRPHVANMLRLLMLPEAIQEMVREGKLTAGHARALLASHEPLTLARRAIANGLSVREVERLAAQTKDGAEAKAEKPAKDADLRALEETLSKALGLAVTIASRGEGTGEVKLAYKRLDQLDDICRRLSAA